MLFELGLATQCLRTRASGVLPFETQNPTLHSSSFHELCTRHPALWYSERIWWVSGSRAIATVLNESPASVAIVNLLVFSLWLDSRYIGLNLGKLLQLQQTLRVTCPLQHPKWMYWSGSSTAGDAGGLVVGCVQQACLLDFSIHRPYKMLSQLPNE